jgi:hypothetical protein
MPRPPRVEVDEAAVEVREDAKAKMAGIQIGESFVIIAAGT